MSILLLGILIYAGSILGQTKEEEGIVDDLKQLSTLIPRGAKITACCELIETGTVLAYAQRYFEWELQLDAPSEWILMKTNVCEPTNSQQKPVMTAGELLLYRR